MNQETSWMQDPAIQSIPQEKLQFLEKMFFESKKLSNKEKLPFFLSLAKKAKDSKIQFSKEEIDIILPVIKKNATPEELVKIDKMMGMMKSK